MLTALGNSGACFGGMPRNFVWLPFQVRPRGM